MVVCIQVLRRGQSQTLHVLITHMGQLSSVCPTMAIQTSTLIPRPATSGHPQAKSIYLPSQHLYVPMFRQKQEAERSQRENDSDTNIARPTSSKQDAGLISVQPAAAIRHPSEPSSHLAARIKKTVWASSIK